MSDEDRIDAMATRTYRQRARAAEAARTRMRIIEAVLSRLRKAPVEPIAIDQIAREAGVARSTVYAIFGSRSGLFDAVGRELADRSGYARLLDAKHQPDAREHLRAGFRAATEMFAAHRDIYRALRSMAQLDPAAVGGVVERMDSERAAGMARLVGRLAEQGVLREGLSAADAEHVLWVLSSFETFDSFYTGRGLSTERTIELLIQTAERAVYAQSNKRRGRGTTGPGRPHTAGGVPS
jgi:AcrR family transcriptional regulator